MADVALQMKDEEQKKVATDDTSSGSSGNEAGDENELKGSDNENDENEGEVTEAQKKVAEAAGLADQVSGDKMSKQSRSEKKARKLFSKLGLKPVHNVSRIEDLSEHARFAAAERLKPNDTQLSGQGGRMNVTRAQQEEESGDDGEVDATGIEEKDIELVCSQANVSRNRAIKALKEANNDIVNAIMELTM
ncbi:NAC domain-containing protein [Wuchereria bancrofti]|uniref:NAC domain-containing protein n=1 Tax=Wuchereria bancrofti TaxID=6293 RepID=J9EXD4_WUCBA|nr:NAC domain-containing protein [Wuchereria bancrofti]